MPRNAATDMPGISSTARRKKISGGASNNPILRNRPARYRDSRSGSGNADGEEIIAIQRRLRKARNQRRYYQRHQRELQEKARVRAARTRENKRGVSKSISDDGYDHFLNKYEQQHHPSPSPSPSSSHSHTISQQSNQSISLSQLLLHDLPGRLDYTRRMLLTAEKDWGPIDHWAFSFKRRWKEAVQADDIEEALSKGRTLVELGRRGIVFMIHMMDGIEGNGSLDEYRWIWVEASRLTGMIYDGVIRLEQQIELASEYLYSMPAL